MENNFILVGEYESQWDNSGTNIINYFTRVTHTKLNKYKEIIAPDMLSLSEKVEEQINIYNREWAKTSNDLIDVKKYKSYWNAANTRVLKLSTRIFHAGLKEYKDLMAPDRLSLNDKVKKQIELFSLEWDAVVQNKNASQAILDLNEILMNSIKKQKDKLWNLLKIYKNIKEESPQKPHAKIYKDYPAEPKKKNVEFGFLDK